MKSRYDFTEPFTGYEFIEQLTGEDFVKQLKHFEQDVAKNFKVDIPVNLDILFNPNPPKRTALEEKNLEFFEDSDPAGESNVNKRIFEKNADLLRGGLSVILPETLLENAADAFQRTVQLAKGTKQKNLVPKKLSNKLKNKNWLDINRKEKLQVLKAQLDYHERIIDELWRNIEPQQKALEFSSDQWAHEMHQETLWWMRHSLTSNAYAFENYFIRDLIARFQTVLNEFQTFMLSLFTTEATNYASKPIPALLLAIKSFLFVWRHTLKTNAEPLVDPQEKALFDYLKAYPIYFMHDAKALLTKYLGLRFDEIPLQADFENGLEDIIKETKINIEVEKKQGILEEHKLAFDHDHGNKHDESEDDKIMYPKQIDAVIATPEVFEYKKSPAKISSSVAHGTAPQTPSFIQRFVAWVKQAVKNLFSSPSDENKKTEPQTSIRPGLNIFKCLGINIFSHQDENKDHYLLPNSPTENEKISLSFSPLPPEVQRMEDELEFNPLRRVR